MLLEPSITFLQNIYSTGVTNDDINIFIVQAMESAKDNLREPKSCLGQVFSFKLGSFCCECKYVAQLSTPTLRIENSAQVLSCQLKFVHVVT
jgi:hypothetical protein